jgi:peptidoglycan hydrolase CwlO-like protein
MKTRPILMNAGFVKASLAASAVIVAVSLTSCGASKITDEQKNQLSELRRQQASLGEKIKLKATDIARLESEIAERERAVAKCTEEKLALEQRLAKWPNAWPDYTEPAKDTTSAKKKTK